PFRQQDEIELVRRDMRRIHERVRPAEHRLLRARRRRQREPRELTGGERDVGRAHLQRIEGIRPLALAGDASFDPCGHDLPNLRTAREAMTSLGKINHYAYAESPVCRPRIPRPSSTAATFRRSRLRAGGPREPSAAWTVGESPLDPQ